MTICPFCTKEFTETGVKIHLIYCKDYVPGKYVRSYPCDNCGSQAYVTVTEGNIQCRNCKSVRRFDFSAVIQKRIR